MKKSLLALLLLSLALTGCIYGPGRGYGFHENDRGWAGHDWRGGGGHEDRGEHRGRGDQGR